MRSRPYARCSVLTLKRDLEDCKLKIRTYKNSIRAREDQIRAMNQEIAYRKELKEESSNVKA